MSAATAGTFLIPQREGSTMPDDGTQDATPGGGGGGDAALNPVFRTAPATDPAAQQGTAAQKPAPRQGAAQDRAGAQGADGRSPEDMLADAAQDDDDQDSLTKAQEELARLKANARKWEKHAKENAEKARNYDAHLESQQTEQERLTSQLAAAQQEARDAREDRFRLLAAAQYDLPPSLIGHLGSGTEDEINERAEAFAQAINERAAVLAAAQAQAAAQQQPRNGNGGFRPVESLRPGALPASGTRPNDPDAWIRQALGSKR